MRKFVAGLIIGVVIAMGLPVSASDAPAAPPVEESAPIKLVVNGQEITLPDAQPVVIDNRVMVPLMAFSQVAGFGATWVEETRTVLVTTQTTATQVVETQEQPLTMVINDVTHYEGETLGQLLKSLYPDQRIGMSVEGVSVGDTRYPVVTEVVGDRGYADVRPLLDAGVLTQDDLDRFYGK